MQNSIDNFYNFTISTSVAMSNRCELFPIDLYVDNRNHPSLSLNFDIQLTLKTCCTINSTVSQRAVPLLIIVCPI